MALEWQQAPTGKYWGLLVPSEAVEREICCKKGVLTLLFAWC